MNYDQLTDLGEKARDDEDYSSAVDLYQAALKLAPDDTYVLYNLAVCLRGAGRYKEALAPLSRSIELEPDEPDAWYALGNLRRSLKDLEGALQAYLTSLRLEANDVDVINNYALTLRNLGRFDESSEAVEKGLAISPADAELNYNKGLLLMESNPSGAIVSFRRTIIADPSYVEAWEHLERLHAQLGEHGEALEAQVRARYTAPKELAD